MSDQPTRPTRERSPSFPFISLKVAVKRLTEFEEKFGRQEPPADRVYLAWGMKGDTSQAQQTLAALKSFGLVQYNGAGPKRPVAMSEDARTYLRAQQDSVKKDVLKRIALKPRWIAHFWPLWGVARGPDEVCLDTLVLTHKFNENAAPNFLSVYDETIAFVGLSDSDKSAGAPEAPVEDEPPPDRKRKVQVMEGERELTTGLLAKDANFRLIVSGKIGVREIERLIQKLELDKEILAEQSEDEPAEQSLTASERISARFKDPAYIERRAKAVRRAATANDDDETAN